MCTFPDAQSTYHMAKARTYPYQLFQQHLLEVAPKSKNSIPSGSSQSNTTMGCINYDTLMSVCNISSELSYSRSLNRWYIMYFLCASSKMLAWMTECKSVIMYSKIKWMLRSCSAFRTFNNLWKLCTNPKGAT